MEREREHYSSQALTVAKVQTIGWIAVWPSRILYPATQLANATSGITVQFIQVHVAIPIGVGSASQALHNRLGEIALFDVRVFD